MEICSVCVRKNECGYAWHEGCGFKNEAANEIKRLRATLIEIKGAMVAGHAPYWEKGGPLWARVTGDLDRLSSDTPETHGDSEVKSETPQNAFNKG